MAVLDDVVRRLGLARVPAQPALHPQPVEYLWAVETENMGLDGDRARVEAVAARLLQLRREIDGGE